MKVYLNTDPAFRSEKLLIEAYAANDLWDELSTRGYTRVENEKDADVALVPAGSLTDDMHANTISIERIDGCQFPGPARIQDDRVSKWVKMYRYRDWDTYSLPTHSRRIFTRHLSEDVSLSVKDQPTAFEKVHLGLNFLHYERHLKHRDIALSQPLLEDREFDLFFAGTTDYTVEKSLTEDHRLITQHRQGLLARLQSYEHLNSVLISGRSMPIQQYMQTLRNSRITISPWGWGEACFRDYEALLHGCEVIKPRTYDIATNPDIYNDESMTFCSADWSDLQDLISERLETWDQRHDQRLANQRKVLDALAVEYRADIVESLVRAA